MCYLVNKYSGDDAEKQKLYPTDPEQRAVIDRTLFFDIGTLYKSIVDYFVRLKTNLSQVDASGLQIPFVFRMVILVWLTYASTSKLH